VAVRRAVPALLVLVLLAGLGLRLVALSGKNYLDHDEAISYLSATCHQAEWERVRTEGIPPFGTWVPAAEWQSFLEPDRGWCLGTIGGDLADHDIHPPLYFWLLHPTVLALDVHLWSGPALNLVFYLLAALALFALARRVFRGDERLALVVTAVWSLSPAVVRIFAEARQYELFALLTIVFALLVVRVADPPRPRPLDLVLLALVTAAGALTHYHFAIVAAGGAAWLAWRFGRGRAGRRDLRSLATALGAMLAGYLAFAALHPEFLESFGREQDQAEDFAANAIGTRLERVARAFAAFVVPDELLDSGLATWAVFAVLGVGVAWAVRAHLRVRREAERASGAPLWLLAATGGGTVLLYLTFQSHGLAMGGKYLAAVWPSVAFLPALAIGHIPGPRRATAALAVCALLLACGAAGAVLLYRGPDRPADPQELLAGRDRLVVESVRRGVLPQVLWDVPPGARVLAADQGWLIGHERSWLPAARPPALFVADLRYGDPAARRRVLALLEVPDRVRDSRETLGTDGRVYRIDR
jgi:4-amino-4-deoxy-L-arabinose transferase-like glycosyltransferase